MIFNSSGNASTFVFLLPYKRIIRVTFDKESAQPSRSRIFRGAEGFFYGGLSGRGIMVVGIFFYIPHVHET